MDRITANQVFITIIEQGSMAAAADKLEMSRAMVTRYLAEMEAWAGVRLINRTTRRLSLTSAGEQVYQQALKLNLLAQSLPVQQDKGATALSGLIRISCSQSIANSALSRAISDFLLLYPQMMIDLQISNKVTNLVEDRIDLAIRITNDLEPNLIARPLSTCHSVICASPSYFEHRILPTEPAHLAMMDCLTYNFFGRSIWLFKKQGESFSVPVQGRLSANESTFLADAARYGAGIAMQPYYSVAEYLNSGELIPLLTDYQPQPLGIYAIYTSRQNMPATLRVLLDYLADWFAHSKYWQQLMSKRLL